MRRGKCLVFIMFIIMLVPCLATATDHQPLPGERLSLTCAGCHGTAGAAPGNMIPIIGGQLAGYTAKVLKGFAEDSRPGTVMLNLAKGYTVEEQQQIAEYFAAQPWVNTTNTYDIPRDDNLTRSCRGCHGKNGEGLGNFPRIGGQHPEYLLQALQEYQQGTRKDSMMLLVKGMDDVTLKALADNFAAMK